jgi:hypothetical protein
MAGNNIFDPMDFKAPPHKKGAGCGQGCFDTTNKPG